MRNIKKHAGDCSTRREFLTATAAGLAGFSFVGSAREFCTRRGMVYLLANNEIPMEEMITDYLARRGLVR